MSTDFVFKHPGRLFNYVSNDPAASKEDILEKYARFIIFEVFRIKDFYIFLIFRGSYSTENTWPEESPTAGYYDITNSTTRLILLNNQKQKVRRCFFFLLVIKFSMLLFLKSHLRGQVIQKRPPRVKDEYYDWVEVEHEENEIKEAERAANPDRTK